MDHRRVQRALFRMQLDAGFQSRLRNGDPSATRGLSGAELRVLCGLDESAVRADPGGGREKQFLSNVTSEFPISRVLVRERCFLGDVEFGDAVRDDRSLPLAFARFAQREARSQRSGSARALVDLECALARARRELRTQGRPRSGELVLAPWVWLESAPEGTLALAARIRESIGAGADWPELGQEPSASETLLIRSAPPARPLGLREVEVEHLSPALARLLQAALESATRDALAAVSSTPRAELDPVLDELIADRVLVAG